MARPRADSARVHTEERILQAAEAAFGEVGFDAARLEDIVAAAGITRPSLFYYFPSKESLYASVVQRAFDALQGALAGAIASDLPFAKRLDAVVRAYLDFLRAHPRLAGVLLREVIGGGGLGRELVRQSVVPLIDLVERFIVENGAGALPHGLPVRAAVMMVIASALVETTSGPLRDPLWGSGEHTLDLARRLFLGR